MLALPNQTAEMQRKTTAMHLYDDSGKVLDRLTLYLVDRGRSNAAIRSSFDVHAIADPSTLAPSRRESGSHAASGGMS